MATETPILDLDQPLPASPKRWPWHLLGSAIGLLIALPPILADHGIAFNWKGPGFNGLLFIPAVLIGIAAHELGHLVAGKLRGFGTGDLVIGPLVVSKSGRNWTVRFRLRSFASGFFKPLAISADVDRHGCMWMIAGGPIASLLLTVASWLLFELYGDGTWKIVGTLCWTSLFLFLVALIPAQGSDAGRLLQLSRHPGQTDGFLLLVKLQTEEVTGVRPCEWTPQFCDALLNIEPSSTEYLWAQLFTYYRRVDEGHKLAALPHLERALAKSSRAKDTVRAALLCEAASACARVKNDVHKARVWRDRALPLLRTERETLAPVDAAIAMCENRYDDALQLFQSARERALRRKLDSGLVRFALAKWQEAEAECRERSMQVVSVV